MHNFFCASKHREVCLHSRGAGDFLSPLLAQQADPAQGRRLRCAFKVPSRCIEGALDAPYKCSGDPWEAFGDFGRPCDALGGVGRQCKKFEGFGKLWKILDNFLKLWETLGGSGKRWDALRGFELESRGKLWEALRRHWEVPGPCFHL